MNGIWTHKLVSCGVESTLELGARIGEGLGGGDVVAMTGPLGAGKTHLTKGMARGLGVANDRAVSSPTFVLVNEYIGRVRVLHLDAYRLRGGSELESIGFEEMCGSGAVLIIEWADRVKDVVPSAALWVEMAVAGESERSLALACTDSDLSARVAAALDRAG